MKLLLVISLFVYQSLAWWENGHLLVAQIAENILTKDHKEIYNRANKIVLAMNGLDYDIDNTFVTSACWADDVKDSAWNFLDSWHFYGRPVNPTGTYLMQDPVEAQNNAETAMGRIMYELNETNTGTDINMQKAMFMRYLIHITGDVHQPLHSVNMFNDTFSGPNGDMGGNLLEVIDQDGNKLNLHSFWDQGAELFQTEDHDPISRPFNATTAKKVSDIADQLMTEYPKSHYNKADEDLDISVWTRESFVAASDYAYPLVFKQNTLDADYKKKAQDICKERVTLAGYRLANVLVELYKQYETQQPQPSKVQAPKRDYHSGFEIEKEISIKNLRKNNPN